MFLFWSSVGMLMDLQLRSKCQNCWVYFLIDLSITLLWKAVSPQRWARFGEHWDRSTLVHLKLYSYSDQEKGGEKSYYKSVPIRQTGELNSFQLTSCLANRSPKALWVAYRKRGQWIQSHLIHTAFMVSGSHDAIPTAGLPGKPWERRMYGRWVNLASERTCLFEAFFECIWWRRNLYLCSLHKM